MDYTTDYFYETFTPCTEERLAEIEASLGRKLPEGYRDLLRQTGGGEVAESKKFIFPMDFYREGYEVAISTILGNTFGADDITESPVLMGPTMWDAPEGLLIFAFGLGGPGESLGINYGREEFPPLSIIYVFVEDNNEMVKIADSFEEFMSKLLTHKDLGRD